MRKGWQIRNLISVALLAFALFLFAAGGFEITGKMGTVSLPQAIALSLAAQATAYFAGFVALPKDGRTGPVRSMVFVFFLIQSISFLVNLVVLMYGRLHHVEVLDSSELIWGLVLGANALALVFISGQAWNLFKGKRADRI